MSTLKTQLHDLHQQFEATTDPQEKRRLSLLGAAQLEQAMVSAGLDQREIHRLRFVLKHYTKSMQGALDALKMGSLLELPCLTAAGMATVEAMIDTCRTGARVEAFVGDCPNLFVPNYEVLADGTLARLGELNGLPDQVARMNVAIHAVMDTDEAVLRTKGYAGSTTLFQLTGLTTLGDEVGRIMDTLSKLCLSGAIPELASALKAVYLAVATIGKDGAAVLAVEPEREGLFTFTPLKEDALKHMLPLLDALIDTGSIKVVDLAPIQQFVQMHMQQPPTTTRH